MRSIVFAAALLPAVASVAKSQQLQPATPATSVTAQQVAVAPSVVAPNVRLVDAPLGITPAQARTSASQSNALTKGAAAVDSNMKNMLAIVGAVVIVIALLAFLL